MNVVSPRLGSPTPSVKGGLGRGLGLDEVMKGGPERNQCSYRERQTRGVSKPLSFSYEDTSTFSGLLSLM